MVRDLGNAYLEPSLAKVLPPNRLGAAPGDAPKVSCATRHIVVHKALCSASAWPEASRS